MSLPFNQQPNAIYDSDFFQEKRDAVLKSARVIVPIILEVYPAQSVIDVGCGDGAWLSIFQSCGVQNIQGLDGNSLPAEAYLVDQKQIRTNVNFESQEFQIPAQADLITCLEVAEHLPARNARQFIGNLAGHAPLIIFSAAVPGQLGTQHINEQPPWFWREVFHGFDFIEIDFIRPLIWGNPEVAWWYRQNITAYVRRDFLNSHARLSSLSLQYPSLPDGERLTVISERILRSYLARPRWKLLNFFLKLIFPKY